MAPERAGSRDWTCDAASQYSKRRARSDVILGDIHLCGIVAFCLVMADEHVTVHLGFGSASRGGLQSVEARHVGSQLDQLSPPSLFLIDVGEVLRRHCLWA